MLYLIEDRDYLKIGYAKSIKKRMSNYITENVYAKLIDYKKGDLIDEKSLHKLCAKYKYKGEWFLNCKEVIEIWKSYDKNKRQELDNLIFKEVVAKYNKTKMLTDLERSKYPWLEDAFNILGFKTFSQQNYVQKKIIKLYQIWSDKSLEDKIAIKLNSKIELGKFYKPGDIKKILTNIYNDLGINQTAKSNDIEKYYLIEFKAKKIQGNTIKGIIPVTALFRIK